MGESMWCDFGLVHPSVLAISTVKAIAERAVFSRAADPIGLDQCIRTRGRSQIRRIPGRYGVVA